MPPGVPFSCCQFLEFTSYFTKICFLLFQRNSFALILFCKKAVQNCCLQASLEVLLPLLAEEATRIYKLQRWVFQIRKPACLCRLSWIKSPISLLIGMHGKHISEFLCQTQSRFQLSVVPNSRNCRQAKLLLATCSSPKLPMPDVCSVSAAQAEQGGPRTLLSAIRIKQCKENMCFFGKLCCLPLLVKGGKMMKEDFSQEQFFSIAPTRE